jgi:alcohol dehydrogenase class IV
MLTGGKMFDFSVRTRVKFGCGVRRNIGAALQEEGWQQIGVVVDHNLLKMAAVVDLLAELRQAVENLTVGSCTISEPTYESLEAVRQDFANPSLQAILGIGGGSAMDMAKAMAVLVHNRKPAIEYRGFDKMTEPVLPVVAVPTTAGSGSEVTPNASFIDSVAKKKMGINGEAVRPRYAFLDPELTLSCPPEPTIAAAADSLVHAMEALAARNTNPMARLFAREGFRQVFGALPGLKAEPGNLGLRTRVMYGAFLSGIALMHSGTGPAAAMSYPLGVHYGVAHGLGGAIFLPHVMEHNIRNGFWDYADFYDVLNDGDPIGRRDEKAVKLLESIFELFKQLEVPENLGFCGYRGTSTQRTAFIQETMELKGALNQNPVPFGAKEIQQVLSILADS